MTALTWETLLILAVVYFAGCCIGCLARRGYWARRGDEPVVVSATEPPAPVADRRPNDAIVGMPAVDAGLAARASVPTSASAVREPFRRAAADPSADAPLATPRDDYAVPLPSSPAARFERALTGDGSRPDAASRPLDDAPEKATVPIAAVPVVESAAPDDLKRIMGIDAEIEKRLHGLGMTSYAAIAQWTAADTAHISRELGFKGRIEQENWIEQAQILARGGDTRYSLRLARGEIAAARGIADEGEPGPIKAAPAIKAAPKAVDTGPPPQVSDRAAFARQAAAVAVADASHSVSDADGGDQQANAEPLSGRTSDVTALRSVRSQGLRPMEGGAPVPGRAGRPAAADDLKRIRGIGVLIEKRLNAMGVTAYEQIANWTAAEIEKVSQTLDFKGRIERENWVEQGRILASGGQTEFSRRLDRGRHGEDR